MGRAGGTARRGGGGVRGDIAGERRCAAVAETARRGEGLKNMRNEEI